MNSESPVPVLPTIIVVHPKEKRSKCSVEPLRGRDDFVFWTFPHRGEFAVENTVRLGLNGPPLSHEDRHSRLLLLDGTWRLAEKMEQQYPDVPVRSLWDWKTAYPRTSKLFEDPAAGLATIEALFAALTQMNQPTTGLLDHYLWRDQFLEKNAHLLSRQV
ncbi:hypothetical protein SH661x_000206 [Planctomicrobium sp. SH661]|uniref:hypothetical protein n=1 Tax=Planctomicrobium sp. SH661 TaxID=3448124 RepID=UPI003F5C5FE9